MAIALVASLIAPLGGHGGTTAAIDTTGATLLAVSVSSYTFGGAIPTVSDSKGNTYTGLTNRETAARHRWYYCLAPTVGTGHTITITATGTAPSVFVYACSGVGSYQTESGATFVGTASLASGSVTPSADGALILTAFSGLTFGTAETLTPSGFTVASITGVSGVNMEGSAAYVVQTTAATINPTWAFSPSQTEVAVGTAVFLPATTTDAHVTQDAIEVLTPYVNTTRVSQSVVELLSTVAPVAPPTAASATVTQSVVELLTQLVDTGRVTQLVVEAFVAQSTVARATQLAVEVFHPLLIPARTTQLVVEYFEARSAALRASQVIVEVFLALGPPPAVCPLDFPIDPGSPLFDEETH